MRRRRSARIFYTRRMRSVQIETECGLAAARLFIWSLTPNCLHCLVSTGVSLFVQAVLLFFETLLTLLCISQRFLATTSRVLVTHDDGGFFSRGVPTDYIALGQVSSLLLCLYYFSDLPLTTVFAVLRLVMKPLADNYQGDHLIMFKLISPRGLYWFYLISSI